MLCDLVQPGKWVNIVTNLTYQMDDKEEEDIVSSPVFILTREERGFNLTAMVIDQRLSLLVWYFDNNARFSTIAGRTPHNHSFHASVVKFSFEDIILTFNTHLILEAAQQRKEKFLKNCPEMENEFFKTNPESILEEKDVEKIEEERFLCPITFERFKDPVTAPDGRNYERTAIVAWLKTHGTSPITLEPMKVEQLITNYGLR